MSEGFDYQAWRTAQNGGNPDKALIVSFFYEAEKQKDGSFKNVEMIRIWLDKNNEVTRKVSEEDKVRFSERYESFQKGTEVPPEGTPIAQCPFATPADVSTCRSERIFTLEQLVETPDERLQRGKLINFKYKSRDFLESQRRSGYVGELRDEIDALKAQIEVLKGRAVEQPVKRGRPRKNGDTTLDSE